MFNMYQSMFSYNCAKFVLNTVKYNIATTTKDEIIGLLKLNSKVNLFLENETGILEMHSNLTKNVSMILDLKTGIMTYILCIDGFEYKGAITENLTPDIINQTNKTKVMTECFEDRLSSDFIDKTKNILGMPLDSGWVELEGILGGIMIDLGFGVLTSGFVDVFGIPVGLCMMSIGAYLCADANGWTTDPNNISRCINTGIDIGLTFVPSALLSRTSMGVFRIATINKEIFYEADKIGKTAYIALKGFEKAQENLYGEVMEKITIDPLKNGIESYLSSKN